MVARAIPFSSWNLPLWLLVILLSSGFFLVWFRYHNKKQQCPQLLKRFLSGDNLWKQLGHVGLPVVILLGAVLRLWRWDEGIPASIFGGLIEMRSAQKFLDAPDKLHHWLWDLFKSPGPRGWGYESPIFLPLDAFLRFLFEANLHLEVFSGALWSLTAMFLLWWIGRTLNGARYGLLFAAFLAVSPLQVTWSRLGFRAIAGVTHVLLVMAMSLWAGRRRSFLLAWLSGVCGFLSIFSHDSARVSIPLGAIALVQGFSHPWKERRQVVLLLLSMLLGYIAPFYLLNFKQGIETFFPHGINDSLKISSGANFLDSVVRSLSERYRQAVSALDMLFLHDRALDAPSISQDFGIADGGHVFTPVVILGVIGIFVMVAQLSRTYLWFFMWFAGLAIPAMSCAQSRRLLVMDAAWCVFAGFGLSALSSIASSTIAYCMQCASVTKQLMKHIQVILSGLVITGLAFWCWRAMILLRNPTRIAYSVPFAGAGCAGDVVFCPTCVDLSHQWERDIAAGGFVLSFDSDEPRENPTGPTGLYVLGELAAYAAGKPKSFVDFYRTVKNRSLSSSGVPHFSESTLFVDYLNGLFREVYHKKTQWYFVTPVAWERWLIAQLTQFHGAEVKNLNGLGYGDTMKISLPAMHDGSVIQLLRKLFETPSPRYQECPIFHFIDTVSVAPERFFKPQSIVPLLETDDVRSVDSWVLIDQGTTLFFRGTYYKGIPFRDLSNQVPSDQSWTLAALNGEGKTFYWKPGQISISNENVTPPLVKGPMMSGCSVRYKNEWISLDPFTGTLTSNIDLSWLPSNIWVGLNLLGDQLLLAGADQSIQRFNLLTREREAQFTALVTPRVWEPFLPGTCTPLAAGDQWVAILDSFSNRILLYSPVGKLLSILPPVNAWGRPYLRTVAASKNVLAVGRHENPVMQLFNVDIHVCKTVEALEQDRATLISKKDLFDFESGTLTGWIVSGKAFGESGIDDSSTSLPGQLPLHGVQGRYLLNSFFKRDDSIGEVRSPDFVLDRNFMRLNVGGGNQPGQCEVVLVVDGKRVRSATGQNSEELKTILWDIGEYKGKSAYLEVHDRARGPWGHILVDDIALVDIDLPEKK